MPKIDIAAARERIGFTYPEPYRSRTGAKHRRVIGEAAGLTQFGANLSTLPPGAQSALRHWHEHEDEFVWIVSGEVVLIENDGETVLRAGDCAGFPAGVPNAHHLVNRSDQPAIFLEVGMRVPIEQAHYPDDDVAYRRQGETVVYTRKDGSPG